MKDWTEQKERVIHSEWVKGTSSATIAKMLTLQFPSRVPFTKDMVVGKARRMGLPSRGSPIKPRTTPVEKLRNRSAKRREVGDAHKKDARRLDDLTKRRDPAAYTPAPRDKRIGECVFVITENRPHKFCGERTLPGDPYCAAHREQVRVKQPS